jgi:hypothetical protein
LKPVNITKVKRHLFEDDHLLDSYKHLGVPAEMRRFDADIRIAEAWQRLATGKGAPADIRLLKHEIAEAWYMRANGAQLRGGPCGEPAPVSVASLAAPGR